MISCADGLSPFRANKIYSCEKNVFDEFLKSHFVTSTVHAEECIVAASAPI